jgi:hypothetical protein
MEGLEMNNELINALQEFKNAYNNLLDQWFKNDVLNETESIKLYPFNNSFDELEINKWIDSTITELNGTISTLMF